jgi:Tn3 transposase DDE domain
VATARARAERDTYDRLASEFTLARCAGLNAMLRVDPEIGMTRLRWLGRGPVEASAAAVKTEVRKLTNAHEGAIRRRHLQQQADQAWCLTLATTGIITWTTECLGLVVDQLRGQGRRVDDLRPRSHRKVRSQDRLLDLPSRVEQQHLQR